MRRFRKKCLWCSQYFHPHPRLGDRQQSCGSQDCKREQKRFSQRNWQQKERDDYRQAQKDWRAKRPDYWQTYRKEHPAYKKRNRIQSKIRWQFAHKTLQKRIDILEVPEKQMEYWHLTLFAKRPRSLVPLLAAYTVPHEFICRPQQSQAP